MVIPSIAVYDKRRKQIAPTRPAARCVLALFTFDQPCLIGTTARASVATWAAIDQDGQNSDADTGDRPALHPATSTAAAFLAQAARLFAAFRHTGRNGKSLGASATHCTRHCRTLNELRPLATKPLYRLGFFCHHSLRIRGNKRRSFLTYRKLGRHTTRRMVNGG